MHARDRSYFTRRADHATFGTAGYPISSGIVEGANKVVVEARLKGRGRHWAPTIVHPWKRRFLTHRTDAPAEI